MSKFAFADDTALSNKDTIVLYYSSMIINLSQKAKEQAGMISIIFSVLKTKVQHIRIHLTKQGVAKTVKRAR